MEICKVCLGYGELPSGEDCTNCGGKCPFHPTYKVLRKPTANCETCRQLWKKKESV